MSGPGDSNFVPLAWGTLRHPVHMTLPTRFVCPPNCTVPPPNLSCYIPEVSPSGTFMGYVPLPATPINPNSPTQPLQRPGYLRSATPCVSGSDFGESIEAQGITSLQGNAFNRSSQRSDSLDNATERFLKIAKQCGLTVGLTVGIKDKDESPKDKASSEMNTEVPDIVATIEKKDSSLDGSLHVQISTVDDAELTEAEVKENEKPVELNVVKNETDPPAENVSSELNQQYHLDVKAQPYLPCKSSSCIEFTSSREVALRAMALKETVDAQEQTKDTLRAMEIRETVDAQVETEEILRAMALKETVDAQVQTKDTLRAMALKETVDAQVETEEILWAMALKETVDAQVQTKDMLRAMALKETVDAQVQTEDTLKAIALKETVDVEVQTNDAGKIEGTQSCDESQREIIESGQLRSSQKTKKYGPETKYKYVIRLAALIVRNSPAILRRPEELNCLLLKKLTAFCNRFKLVADSKVDPVTCQLAVQLLVENSELADWKSGTEYFTSILAEITNYLEKGHSVVLEAYQKQIAALDKLAELSGDQECGPNVENTDVDNMKVDHNETSASSPSTTSSFASVVSHLSTSGSFSSMHSPLVSPSIGEEFDDDKGISSPNEDPERADLVACFQNLTGTFLPKSLSALPKKSTTPLTMPAPEISRQEMPAPEMPAPEMYPTEIPLPEMYAPKMHAPEMHAPEMPSPKMHAPKMPAPDMYEPEMPAPEMPAPEMPAPEMPAPEMPAPEMPAPEMPAPKMPAPEMYAPKMPAPKMLAPEMYAPEMLQPKMPAPEKYAPEMPAPKMPAPEMPAPEMPEPKMYAPEMPAPKMPAPEMYAPKMPAPKMPAPQMPAPEMYAPKMPAPKMIAQEMYAPEMPAPEMPAPEMYAPKRSAPETLAPEMPAPKMLAPETPAPKMLAPEIYTTEMPALKMPAPKTLTPEMDRNSVAALELILQTVKIRPAAVSSTNSSFQQTDAVQPLLNSATDVSVNTERDAIITFQKCSGDERSQADLAVKALRQPTLDISHYKNQPKNFEGQDETVSQHNGSIQSCPLTNKVFKRPKPLDMRRIKAAQASSNAAYSGATALSVDVTHSKEDELHRWNLSSGQFAKDEDRSCVESVISASVYKRCPNKQAQPNYMVDEDSRSCVESVKSTSIHKRCPKKLVQPNYMVDDDRSCVESVKSTSTYKRCPNKLVQPIYLTPAQRKKYSMVSEYDKEKARCTTQEEELTERSKFYSARTGQRLCSGDSKSTYAPSLSPSSFSSVSCTWPSMPGDGLSALRVVTSSPVKKYNYDSSPSGSEGLNASEYSRRYNSILDEIDYGGTTRNESFGAEKNFDRPGETSRRSSHIEKPRSYDCLDEIKVSDPPPSSGKEDGKNLSTLPKPEGPWSKLSGQNERSMEERLIDFRLQDKYSNLMKLIQEAYPFLTREESMTALEMVFETCDGMKGMRQQRILSEVDAAIQFLYSENK